jgi:hypothetical protein
MQALINEQEGVIKYRLRHTQAALDAAVDITQINAWRGIMQRLGLIGRHPGKYGGLGYGNISVRLQHPPGSFIVSGTQTGHLAQLRREHYCIVLGADPPRNSLDSAGPCRPSSEALTHAVVYRQIAAANCVIHVHSPEIWRGGAALQLPSTVGNIRYGSPEMAAAVAQLLTEPQCLEKRIFTMRGHEDGVVAFGTDPQAAAQCLIACLAESLAIANKDVPG